MIDISPTFDRLVVPVFDCESGLVPFAKGKEMQYGYVYIMASRRNGTLYIGVTSGLKKRVWEHKNDLVPGFTSRYRIHTLVYFEVYEDIRSAIIREKQMKKWRREWKIGLIEKANLSWRDLYDEL